MNNYQLPKKADYSDNSLNYFDNPSPEQKIESKIGIRDIGQTVTEGSRFGTLIKTSMDAIKKGTSQMELQLGMGGGAEAVGAESYGNEAREALREIARANQIEFTSVHAPTQIGNLSGFDQRQNNFSDEIRASSLDEIKKAIRFAADVGGKAVVVHTGEFQRDMSEAKWNREIDDKGNTVHEFLSFPSEKTQQVHYLVDKRTGKLITDVKKNQVVYEPRFRTLEGDDNVFVDRDGNPIAFDDYENRVPILNKDKTGFEVERRDFSYFQKVAENHNKNIEDKSKHKTAAQMFIESRLQNQILQSKGHAKYYSQHLKEFTKQKDELSKQIDFVKNNNLDGLTNEQKISYLASNGILKTNDPEYDDYLKLIEENKPLSEIIKKKINDIDSEEKRIFEMNSSYSSSAKETEETIKNISTVENYAKEQSLKSYAELGIYAMEESNRKDVNNPVFVAPENIFPEMGYGSHPEELIELVKTARGKMIEFLTEKKINDPNGTVDENGNPIKINNPYYQGINKSQAEKEAKEHIKATLDTQHLGMWWKHFQPLHGETTDQRKKRFDDWYMKMVEKMQKEDIIGNIHLVDAMGAGHHHLPAGQGNLPVVKAIEFLKEKGFKGSINSEAHGEEGMFGAGRMLTKTWEAFNSPISFSNYGISSPTPSWGDVSGFYGRHVQSPYFIFGSYVPSNDWRLWSEVPFE
jgi:sugar phosphate isomerase/epimerase